MSKNVRTYIQGYEVELSKIDAELLKFWASTAKDEEENAVLKATTLNIIFLSNNEKSYQEATKLVAGVTEHHPARMILAHIDSLSNDEKIKAHISAYCQPPQQSGKQICCEQISLSTGERGLQHLNGAILPLLLPDLPVFLVLPPVELLDSENFETLVQLADRIVLDTPATFLDQEALQKTATHITHLDEESYLSDLAWSRLTKWREAIAQLFDSQIGMANLSEIESLEINTSGTANSFAGYLVLLWLATRLGWTFESMDELENKVTFRGKNQRTVKTNLVAEISHIPSGTLLKVQLFSSRSNQQAVYNCHIEKNCIISTVTVNGQIRQSNKFDFVDEEKEKLLCDELDFLHEDIIYLKAVKAMINLF